MKEILEILCLILVFFYNLRKLGLEGLFKDKGYWGLEMLKNI